MRTEMGWGVSPVPEKEPAGSRWETERATPIPVLFRAASFSAPYPFLAVRVPRHLPAPILSQSARKASAGTLGKIC